MNCKVVLVGQTKVGKTAIAIKYVKDETSQPLPTTGVDILNARVTVNGQTANLAIWDTAGQEEYRTLTHLYYQDVNIAVIVYSVDNKPSFEAVRSWYDDLANNDINANIAIVGNKSDLPEEERQVSYDEGFELATELEASFFETSALTGEGVKNMFEKMTENYLSNIPAEVEENNTVELNGNNEPNQKKGGCC